MSFTDQFSDKGFAINLGESTEVLARFHRKLMDRRAIDWEALRAEDYDARTVDRARQEWSARAVTEYYSTAQFGQLTHRLCRIGAPVELIGASTRLATDECRHAEVCARVADRLGGREGFQVGQASLSMYDDVEDLWLATYLSILELCCFGETLSVPVLRAMEVVTNNPVIEAVSGLIAADEGYHMNFGWEALGWMTPRLSEAQRQNVRARLAPLMAGFERLCRGTPEVLESFAGDGLVVEEDEQPNLG